MLGIILLMLAGISWVAILCRVQFLMKRHARPSQIGLGFSLIVDGVVFPGKLFDPHDKLVFRHRERIGGYMHPARPIITLAPITCRVKYDPATPPPEVFDRYLDLPMSSRPEDDED